MNYRTETRTVYVTEKGQEFYDATEAKRAGLKEQLRAMGFSEDAISKGRRLFEAEHIFRELMATYDKPGKAAPAADDWIEWKGGECPVDLKTRVEIKFRNGIVNNSLTASGWVWSHGKMPEIYDIVAYRVVSD